jgi:hypothetical protein
VSTGDVRFTIPGRPIPSAAIPSRKAQLPGRVRLPSLVTTPAGEEDDTLKYRDRGCLRVLGARAPPRGTCMKTGLEADMRQVSTTTV